MRAMFILRLLLASSVIIFCFPSSNASDPELAFRQQDINNLLYRVTEPIRSPELKSVAANFHPSADTSVYTDGGKSVQILLDEIEDNRMLKRRHWFSLFNTRQREEALMLFDVLVHCKTWESAINNAAYFRELVNEGEFVYAIYAAVIHSKVARGIVLPALYEVTPHMFTNTEVINKAYTAQMMQTPGMFFMNFTGSKKNPEQRVAYFGEDIGLNVHHVTWHLDFPFWWEDVYGYHLDRKGELFFWVHHQLTARYDAERLSNHLDLVDELYWDQPIVEGFAPHTTYRYGGEFPARPDNVHFEDVDGAVRVRDMIIHESRIRDAIAHGYITAADGSHVDIRDEHGIDHLGDIIESSLYSSNVQYYGALHNDAHILLGRQGDPHGKFNRPPGVMEHFETATRDPAFFRLHKYMDNLFKEHKDSLTPYTKEQIEFAGIDLEDVAIHGELETFFEDFEFDIGNAVDSTVDIDDMELTASVLRLNHYPFSIKFEVNNGNNEDKHGVVRVSFCPIHDANGQLFNFHESRWYCIEIDKFWTKIEPGKNIIIRDSKDSSVTVPDIPTFLELIEVTDEAVYGGDDLHLEEFDRSCGIPNRMLLPKGKAEGMQFRLFAIVTDGETDPQHDVLETSSAISHAQCGVQGEKYPDHQPMGFPLDRRFDDENMHILLTASNVKDTVVTVTHKSRQENDQSNNRNMFII